jgi:peroxiredoxin
MRKTCIFETRILKELSEATHPSENYLEAACVYVTCAAAAMAVASLLQATNTNMHPSASYVKPLSHVGTLSSSLLVLGANKNVGYKTRKIPSSLIQSDRIENVGSIAFEGKRSISVISRAASASTSYNEADLIASINIFTASGEPVQFKDLWDQKNGTAVVALLRHFGCPCCWEFASTLKDAMPKFDSAGVKLIAIGVGTPEKARILGERLPFPLDSLYADPDRKAYDALGLYYGLGRTFFNPASAKVLTRFDSLQKALKNYTISATPEDRSSVLQQGGMFVFKGKELLYARKDEGTGDHAPLDEVLDLCCKAPVS